MGIEARKLLGDSPQSGGLGDGNPHSESAPGSAPAENDAPGRATDKHSPDDHHAVSRDREDYGKAKPATVHYLRHAQLQSGRSPFELTREFVRLNLGRGKLTWPEYVQYGVYDRSRHTPAEQARFITNSLHWPITRACCDMTWQATTEDKWLCSHILARSAIRVPETLAVIDSSDRVYPDTHKISSAAELRDFMVAQDVLPLFGKENRGICSFGAFLAEDADNEAMTLRGQGRLTYETCMAEFVGETPYLLQRLERNHPFFERYTESVATIRVCILLTEEGIKIPFTILKLPSRDNVADSFWRAGNLACKIDVASGEVVTARTKDPFGTTDHNVHPETGAPLVGERLPQWDRVLEMARACAPIFAPVRYQSLDIAIAEDGPVLIEINTGGGFDLPQLASGEGFLTDEVTAFFQACGYQKLT